MKQETAVGRNRTGLGNAPRKGREAGEAGWQPIPAAPGDPVELARVRAYYGRQAEPVGTVPPAAPQGPGAQPPFQASRGGNPAVLIDRLGERLAQARVGARLYEMLLGKLEAEASPAVSARSETLRRFRDQEVRNFRLLWECIERLGADPTVETPCADLSGVRSMGLIKLLSDPRATFAQSLDAMLVAELADYEGWRLLASLAEVMGKADLADAFRAALAGEGLQLETIRGWWSEANLSPAGQRWNSPQDFGDVQIFEVETGGCYGEDALVGRPDVRPRPGGLDSAAFRLVALGETTSRRGAPCRIRMSNAEPKPTTSEASAS